MLEWESARYPEGGTYLGPVDFVFNGPDRQFLSPGLGFATRGAAAEPKQRGEFGLSARWSPEWLDGTVGFYYRNFADKLPQAAADGGRAERQRYNLIYADNIDLFGVSLAQEHRRRQRRRRGLVPPQHAAEQPGAGRRARPAGQGDTKGPRGDTWHGWSTCSAPLPKTPLFDAATWLAELAFAHWTKVRSGANLFNAVGFAPCLPTAPAAPHSTSGTAAPPRTTSASASPSRRPGSRCSRASTCRRR